MRSSLVHIAAEATRVLLTLPAIELARRTRSPAVALASFRSRPARRRNARDRGRLRYLIHLVDRVMPGGGNCFRRVLLETALDRGAADDKVVFGLKSGGGRRSGHAWLAALEPRGRYDVEFEA